MAESIAVLHVDDDHHVAELTATFLEREDDRFTVETAADASEGLDRLAAEEFDCIVSDYDMPGRNGIEFLESVRADDPDLPFILFTGKGSEAVASDAISAGVTDYLQKEGGTDQYTVLANRIGNAVEHYRSQRMVERSERRLREIVDSLPHALYVVDEEGRYRLANAALAEFHDAPIEEIEGSHVSDVLEEPAAERFVERFERVLGSESAEQFAEVELTDPDGETYVFEPRLLPYELTDADIRAVLGIATDVTERRERERTLERTRERMELALEHTNAVIFEIDFDTGAVTRHGAYREFFDRSPDDVPTWQDHCERVVHPDDRDEFRRFHERLRDGDRTSGEIEYRVVGDSGDTRWIDAHVHLADESGADGRRTLGISRDITDRKRREDRLEALSETTQELMGAETREGVAGIGTDAAAEVLDMDVNGIYLYDDERSALVPVAVTPAARELMGDPPSFTGRDSIAWRVYREGESVAIDDVRDDPDVYNPESAVRSELHIPIEGYGVLLVASETRGAFDQQDTVLGEILASNVAAALEQVERTEQLRARERELVRQNDRLEEFVSVVSHDLRNPLRVADGHLELVMEEGENERLNTVERALDRMDTLIENLLTLAREGDRVRDPEPVDLADCSERCWHTVETAGATLETETELTIRADRSRLQQLFENLIGNAVEHGGPDVTVTVGEIEGGFYVEDDGTGIPQADREDVFDAGFSTSRNGTGFGLSIVKQVVEAHDWEIRATEGSAGGARFEITGVDRPDGEGRG